MLPAAYRLKKRKAFNYIYKNGKHTSGQFVSVLFCRSADFKIGFSASKKVGNSVVRHRAVRLMREAVKPFLTCLKRQQNYIVIAKPGLEKQHLLYITLDLENTLKKSALLV